MIDNGTLKDINICAGSAGSNARNAALSDISSTFPRYIEVPPTILEPLPRQRGLSPSGKAYRKGTAQRHPAEQKTAGLGYSSITPTEPKVPIQPPQLSELILSRLTNPSEILRPYLPLINRFYDYAKLTESYYLHVKTYKPNCKCVSGKYWGYDSHVRPIENRFSHNRRLVKIGRMYEISRYEESLGTRDFTLVTLTRGDSPATWQEFMEDLCKARKHVLDLLNKYCPGIRYVWVVEPHTEEGSRPGWPHIHLMVSQRIDNSVKDSQGRGMEDKLRDLYSRKWGVGSHTYGLDFEYMDAPEMALNYMLKYIGKSFVDEKGWSDAVLIFNAHIYECFDKEPGEGRKVFRSFGCCREYSDLFARDEKESTITLDARLIPMNVEDELPEKRICDREKVVPDWFGVPALAASIVAGAPDYTTRPYYVNGVRYFLHTHWGRPVLDILNEKINYVPH